MKIGVITVYSVPNHGSYLQAYALKQYFEQLGHEVFHAKIYTKEEVRKRFYKYPVTRRSLFHPVEEYKKYLFGKSKYDKFCIDMKEFNELDVTNLSDMDAVVIGSDELWNLKEEEFHNPAYYGSGVKKAATYGISCGRATYEDFDANSEYKEYINSIQFISVRDKKTKRIVEKIIGKEVPMVCDPTFLISTTKMEKEYEDTFLQNNKYLLVYTYYFTYPEWMKDYLIRYAKENELKLVSIGFYFDWCDYCVNCSPLEFSSVIKGAEKFVTTTFHGSVFGVFNHKKMLAVPFSPKVNDLLIKMNRSNCIMEEDLSYDVFCQILNSDQKEANMVDPIIKEMRNQAMMVIDQMIKEFNS